MILSDSKILERINDGEIIIRPFERSQLGSNSYDVRIGKTLLYYDEELLDPKKQNKFSFIEIPEDGFVLKPGKLFLGVTEEYTETKKDVVMFEGKSSLARLGLLVHITSGFGDVGFSGNITLELSCIQPIKIYSGMKIGQIYYQAVEGFVINPYNKKVDAKYNNHSEKPIPSKMFENFDSDKMLQRKRRIEDSGISFDDTELS